jgi:aryl-alcohol dehydrogenase-like predicted oxidoreductase
MQQTITAGGAAIPLLGFGTWQLEGPDARRMTEAALRIGYRHIDTAFIYRNEAEVGEAIRASGVPRDDIFLTTKVWVDFFTDGDLQRAAEGSVQRLGLTPDLLLLHWPKPNPPFADTLKALNDARSRGFTRHIGLSNFPSAQWEEAQGLSEAPLVTNQVEHHPLSDREPAQGDRAQAGLLRHRLVAAGPGQDRRRPRPAGGRAGPRQDARPGHPALAGPERRDRHPPHRQGKPRGGELRHLGFRAPPGELARIDALGSGQGRLGDWLDPGVQVGRRLTRDAEV